MDTIKKVSDYYKKLRNDAIEKAEDVVYKMRKIDEYKNIDDKLSYMEKLLADAEISGDEKRLSSLLKEQKTLLEEKEDILSKYGYTLSDTEPKFNCPICQDTGFVGTKRCECFSKALFKISTEDVGVKHDLLPDFKDFDKELNKDASKVFDKIITFYEKFPDVNKSNIVFSGKTGTGKSFIASMLVKELEKKGFNSVFITSFSLNNVFLEYSSYFSENRFEKLETLLTSDFLVIDDFGAETVIKNVTVNNLLNLITERNLNKKATLITTNLSPKEILDIYGERIYSRIFDKNLSATFYFGGKDIRLK